MKKITLLLALCLSLLCSNSRTARAQFAVTDIPNLAQNITAWIDEIYAAADQLTRLDASLEKYKEMVDKTKQLYNQISPWISEGREVYRLYQQIDRVYNDFEYLESYIEIMKESERITPAKVRHIRLTATYLAEELKEIVNKAGEILKSVNDLSNAQRDDKTKELNDQTANMSESIEEKIELEITESAEDIIGESTTNNLLLAFGFMEDDESEEDLAKEIDDVLSDMADETAREEIYEEDSHFDSNLVSSVFGFVTAVIGVLAVLMLVWAYGRRVKGEPQHQDALWKVFAGLIFILLLLQVLKVCLFDSGLVNL